MPYLPVAPRGRVLRTLLGLFVGWSLACGPIQFGDDAQHTPITSAEGSQPVRAADARELPPPTDDPPVECDSSMEVSRAKGCAIQSIACGDTIEMSNGGQAGHFDDAFYRAKFCSPRSADYEESPEAVYALTLPAEMKADIHLETPCDDLDLFSIRWPHADRCPTKSASTGECEGSTKGSSDTIRIMAVGRDEKHLVWVDGKNGAVGNFRLRVECSAAR